MKAYSRSQKKIIEIPDSQFSTASSDGVGSNISPEMAMMAQILFPGSKEAAGLKSAFDIQQGQQAQVEKQQEKVKKDQESTAALKGFVDVARELKQGMQDISVANAPLQKISGAFGNETALKQFERKKAIVGQFLAKLVEKGRLSDADRTFYQEKILNMSPYGEQEGKEKALENIINDVIRLAGEDPSQFKSTDLQDKKKDQSQSDLLTTLQALYNAPTAQGFARFGENAQQDVNEMVEGMKQLPQAYVQSAQQNPLNPAQPLLQNMGMGILDSYFNLLKNPTQRIYEKPATTFLDLLPFAQMAKSASVARPPVQERITTIADDTIKTPTSRPTNPAVERILSKADEVGQDKGVSQMARNVYQSVLNFSKKNKSFERLKPNQAVATMIEDGISGTPDQIMSKLEKTTGTRGVLNNVVNEAIADTKIPFDVGDFNKVQEVITSSSKGRYGELTPEDFKAVSKNLNDLPQIEGREPGIRDLSRMLQFERQLQAEAQQHRINGLSGDVRSKELAIFKSEVADEVADIIDSKVKNVGSIDNYKTPEIVNYIRDNISANLAAKFQEAKTISELRSLQRDYVRMNQIMELVMQEPSSLGRNLFRVGSQIPVVGSILDTVAQQVAIPVATKSAIGIERLMKTLGK